MEGLGTFGGLGYEEKSSPRTKVEILCAPGWGGHTCTFESTFPAGFYLQ